MILSNSKFEFLFFIIIYPLLHRDSKCAQFKKSIILTDSFYLYCPIQTQANSIAYHKPNKAIKDFHVSLSYIILNYLY